MNVVYLFVTCLEETGVLLGLPLDRMLCKCLLLAGHAQLGPASSIVFFMFVSSHTSVVLVNHNYYQTPL